MRSQCSDHFSGSSSILPYHRNYITTSSTHKVRPGSLFRHFLKTPFRLFLFSVNKTSTQTDLIQTSLTLDDISIYAPCLKRSPSGVAGSCPQSNRSHKNLRKNLRRNYQRTELKMLREYHSPTPRTTFPTPSPSFLTPKPKLSAPKCSPS